MQLNLVVLPGDGVGPEVTAQAVRVLREVANIYGHAFHFEEHTIGGVAIRETGSPLPAVTLEACMRADAVLLGLSARLSSITFPHPTNLRLACCNCAARLAASQICDR